MFTVSDQAYKSFAQSAEESFVSRLADFLWKSIPQLRDVSREAHLAVTRQVFSQAKAHGFDREDDVARFALCAALLGPDFAEHFLGAREILEMKESASYRARLLEYFTRELFDRMGG